MDCHKGAAPGELGWGPTSSCGHSFESPASLQVWLASAPVLTFMSCREKCALK